MMLNKRFLVFAAAVALSAALCGCQGGKTEKSADVFRPEGKADTLLFKQAPFEWHITPRYDYSKVFVTKLFLCQAEFDKEYLGAYKMRDNGQSTVYMTCEQALEAIKGMDAVSPGLQKIVYLVGWQYNGHDSKYPAFFGGNESIKRPFPFIWEFRRTRREPGRMGTAGMKPGRMEAVLPAQARPAF